MFGAKAPNSKPAGNGRVTFVPVVYWQSGTRPIVTYAFLLLLFAKYTLEVADWLLSRSIEILYHLVAPASWVYACPCTGLIAFRHGVGSLAIAEKVDVATSNGESVVTPTWIRLTRAGNLDSN